MRRGIRKANRHAISYRLSILRGAMKQGLVLLLQSRILYTCTLATHVHVIEIEYFYAHVCVHILYLQLSMQSL